jgi:hypothetical protein
MNEEGDGLKAEFEAQAEEVYKREREADEAYAQQLKEDEEMDR